MLEVRHLDQYYGSSHTLRDISLTIPEGSCLALLGRNGAGKTTLLKCIMGALDITSGAILYNGEEISRLPSYKRVYRGLGYVPQGRDIFSNLTVSENLKIAMSANKIPDPKKATEEVIELFPILSQMWNRNGGNLSGGQQQQLAIARALVARPKLLLLDEPTEGIQPSIVKAIEEVIRTLKGKVSILLVEQYYDFACTLADNYVVMSRGMIVTHGERKTMECDDIKHYLSI
jgi:urea transport system ATP-binding protein